MVSYILNYPRRLCIALSVLLNVILGGESNQTFSARNHDWRRRNLPNIVWLIDSLLGKNHCMNSWSYWRVRKN